MTVKELIEINQMILDVVIEVRKDGGLLLDQISIGNDAGVKPPYPTRVPTKPEYAPSLNKYVDGFYKDAAYIKKSINSREDGKDYWETKWSRIPSKYLELEVYSWAARPAYRGIYNDKYREGEKVIITALPNGQHITRPEKQEKAEKPQEIDKNQITIDEWLGGGKTCV